METGFIDEIRSEMDGPEEFRVRPWYNPYGDCIVFHASEEAGYADRVDGVLTLYRSLDTGSVIGFQVKGVSAIVEKSESNGMAVQAKGEGEDVHEITISLLLVMALSEEELTDDRRKAYAEAASLTGERVAVQAALR